MVITIDIPDEVLQRAIAITGALSPEAAVLRIVLEATAHSSDQADIARQLGTSDTFMTPEELERLRALD